MPRSRWPLLAAAAVILVVPLSYDLALAGLKGIGYAVCHQMPEHSLFAAGHQYPLCARCTGIYLGFLTGIAGLGVHGRLKASRIPDGKVAALLFFAMGAMMADVINSLLASAPDARLLYTTTNIIRLSTGLAAGVALALLLVPTLNDALWRKPSQLRSADVPSDLLGYAVLAALVGLVAYSQEPVLYYPVALAGGIGVIAALSTAGAILGSALLRRERQATTLRETAAPLLTGASLAVLSMAALAILRTQLGISLGI